jgi:hypothetical protein
MLPSALSTPASLIGVGLGLGCLDVTSRVVLHAGWTIWEMSFKKQTESPGRFSSPERRTEKAQSLFGPYISQPAPRPAQGLRLWSGLSPGDGIYSLALHVRQELTLESGFG